MRVNATMFGWRFAAFLPVALLGLKVVPEFSSRKSYLLELIMRKGSGSK